MISEILATLASGIFAGAAAYVSLVEHVVPGFQRDRDGHNYLRQRYVRTLRHDVPLQEVIPLLN